MKKITVVKIILVVLGIGTIVFLIVKWNVSLEPPRKIAPAKTQILVEIVIPDVREYEFELPRTLEFTFESDVVNVGDTVQLKYFNKYIAPQEVSRWELVSMKPPFYEKTEFNDNQTGSYTHIEYMKGIIRAVN